MSITLKDNKTNRSQRHRVDYLINEKLLATSSIIHEDNQPAGFQPNASAGISAS